MNLMLQQNVPYLTNIAKSYEIPVEAEELAVTAKTVRSTCMCKVCDSVMQGNVVKM